MTNNLLLLRLAMLVSLTFCLETDLRMDSPSELSTRTARIGRLVVQKDVRLLSGEGEENDGTKVQDGLADHSEGYQSDSQESAAAESKLQRLNPSVHCGDEAMALRVQGNRVPNFMVDRGEEGAVPVAKMPAHCGISMKRVRRDVLLIAEYQGCHVTQQGDDYVLPLHLWGTSMTICCPVASSTNVTNGQPDAPASDPQQHWHPFYPHEHFWHSPTSTPTVATTPAPTPATSTAASTAPAVPASDLQQDWYPFGPFPYLKHPFYPYGHFWHGPTSAPSTAAPTPAPTTTSTAPAVPASDPQQDWYPIGPFPYHRKHPFYPYGHFWHGPTSAPSTAAPTPAPTTTTSTAPAVPASDPQQDWYPFGPFPYHRTHPFYPYGHFWHGPTSAPSTAAPTPAPTTTTSTAPAVPASDLQHPGYPYAPLAYSHRRHPFYPYGYPWMQPADTKST